MQSGLPPARVVNLCAFAGRRSTARARSAAARGPRDTACACANAHVRGAEALVVGHDGVATYGTARRTRRTLAATPATAQSDAGLRRSSSRRRAPSREPAVDTDHLPRQIGCEIREQIRDEPGDLLRLADAARRHELQDLLLLRQSAATVSMRPGATQFTVICVWRARARAPSSRRSDRPWRRCSSPVRRLPSTPDTDDKATMRPPRCAWIIGITHGCSTL